MEQEDMIKDLHERVKYHKFEQCPSYEEMRNISYHVVFIASFQLGIQFVKEEATIE